MKKVTGVVTEQGLLSADKLYRMPYPLSTVHDSDYMSRVAKLPKVGDRIVASVKDYRSPVESYEGDDYKSGKPVIYDGLVLPIA